MKHIENLLATVNSMANQASSREFVFYPETEEFENSFIEKIGLRLKEYFFRKSFIKGYWTVVVYDMSDFPVNEYKVSLKNCNCMAGYRNIECKHRIMLKTILNNKPKK